VDVHLSFTIEFPDGSKLALKEYRRQDELSPGDSREYGTAQAAQYSKFTPIENEVAVVRFVVPYVASEDALLMELATGRTLDAVKSGRAGELSTQYAHSVSGTQFELFKLITLKSVFGVPDQSIFVSHNDSTGKLEFIVTDLEQS